MALTQINPEAPQEKGPSKLENAAKILGIATNLASAGSTGYKTFVTEPNQLAATKEQNDLMRSLMKKS